VERANPDKEIFFFDESRFGTHSKIGHGWFKKGTRTAIPVKLGYQNFYLYSALNPRSGESISYIMPGVDTMCMNVYLNALSQELNEKKIIMIMDGAGWHKSKDLKVPSNIEIIYLPPYSPELNPVERLWGYIKQCTIRNKIYDTLESLEDEICHFLCDLTEETIMSVCNVPYLYNYK
jgi:hypothetical protein